MVWDRIGGRCQGWLYVCSCLVLWFLGIFFVEYVTLIAVQTDAYACQTQPLLAVASPLQSDVAPIAIACSLTTSHNLYASHPLLQVDCDTNSHLSSPVTGRICEWTPQQSWLHGLQCLSIASYPSGLIINQSPIKIASPPVCQVWHLSVPIAHWRPYLATYLDRPWHSGCPQATMCSSSVSQHWHMTTTKHMLG